MGRLSVAFVTFRSMFAVTAYTQMEAGKDIQHDMTIKKAPHPSLVEWQGLASKRQLAKLTVILNWAIFWLLTAVFGWLIFWLSSWCEWYAQPLLESDLPIVSGL